ncbi:hypothetical protein TSAR_016636, partial [Trichomalopsis sarcophagae]
GVTFSHKLSPRTDALLVKRRRKLGPAKTKTLSRGLPKDSKQCAPSSISIHTQSCARANASRQSTLWPGSHKSAL